MIAPPKAWDAQNRYKGMVLQETECYGILKAAVLSQTIRDYVKSSKMLARKRPRSERKWDVYYSRIKNECLRFFYSPPYDYGDIGLKRLVKIIDEEIETEICVS